MMRIFALILMFVLAGCDVPDEERVVQDFRQLFAREAGPGLRPGPSSGRPALVREIRGTCIST